MGEFSVIKERNVLGRVISTVSAFDWGDSEDVIMLYLRIEIKRTELVDLAG
jgi:hypothetical protein